MALDRQDIEKRDFPIGRRGYDPEAVDAHLRSVADEVETVKRNSSRPARDAGHRRQRPGAAIVEAAEASAADISARPTRRPPIRQEAREAASKARSEAATRAASTLPRSPRPPTP